MQRPIVLLNQKGTATPGICLVHILSVVSRYLSVVGRNRILSYATPKIQVEKRYS